MAKGNPGYIDSVKKRSLRFGVAGMVIMFILYFAGLIINKDNGSGWTLIAVFAALPAAQFLARYFSLRKFHSLTEDEASRLQAKLHTPSVCELALVLSKDTCYVHCAAFNDDTITVYSTDQRLTAQRMESLMLKKGIHLTASIHPTMEAFIKGARQMDGERDGNTEVIRDTLIGNAL